MIKAGPFSGPAAFSTNLALTVFVCAFSDSCCRLIYSLISRSPSHKNKVSLF